MDKETKELAQAVYNDAVQPTAQETGKVLSIIPRAIRAALSPVEIWIAKRDYNVEETKKLLAQKLEHVGEQNIVTPEAYVAVPALEAMSYSMDSDELREMYANLLAKAMYDKTKGEVHPSFVEIIKQLSPLDCQVFKIIMSREINPIVDFRLVGKEGGFRVLLRNVTDINPEQSRFVAVSIDNLIRLKLIDVPEDGQYKRDDNYNSIIEGALYREYKETIKPTADGYEFDIKKRTINKTEMGFEFYNVCVKEIDLQ